MTQTNLKAINKVLARLNYLVIGFKPTTIPREHIISIKYLRSPGSANLHQSHIIRNNNHVAYENVKKSITKHN